MHTSTQQQHGKERLARHVPSYARPTVATANRTLVGEGDRPKRRQTLAKEHRLPRQTNALEHIATPVAAAPGPHDPSPTHTLRTNFFDLPGELRNVIYALSITLSTKRYVNLHSNTYRDDPQATLPALLRADKRLLAEASSFYFAAGPFCFEVDQSFLKPFIHYFNLIGPRNRAHLIKNRSVTINLTHTISQCMTMGDHIEYPIGAFQIMGPSASDRFRDLAVNWQLSCKCPELSRRNVCRISDEQRRRMLARTYHPNMLIGKGPRAKMAQLLEIVRSTLAKDATMTG